MDFYQPFAHLGCILVSNSALPRHEHLHDALVCHVTDKTLTRQETSPVFSLIKELHQQTWPYFSTGGRLTEDHSTFPTLQESSVIHAFQVASLSRVQLGTKPYFLLQETDSPKIAPPVLHFTRTARHLHISSCVLVSGSARPRDIYIFMTRWSAV